MADHGINVVETQVGDRYVLEEIERGGYTMGGEQSGHVIFRQLATTGDGLLTGLMLLDVVQRKGRTLADLAGAMTRLPQVLRNVRVASRDRLDAAAALWDEVAAVEAGLDGQGRVIGLTVLGFRPAGVPSGVNLFVPTRDAIDFLALSLNVLNV